MKKVRYIINKEKRAVTCLLPGRYDEIYIGIAKCSPEDEWDEKKGIELSRKRAIIKQCQKELSYLPEKRNIINEIERINKYWKRIDYWQTKMNTIKSEIEDMIVI